MEGPAAKHGPVIDALDLLVLRTASQTGRTLAVAALGHWCGLGRSGAEREYDQPVPQAHPEPLDRVQA